jgi:hypothetical protein
LVEIGIQMMGALRIRLETILGRKFVTLSLRTPLCPYGIAYRRACALLPSGYVFDQILALAFRLKSLQFFKLFPLILSCSLLGWGVRWCSWRLARMTGALLIRSSPSSPLSGEERPFHSQTLQDRAGLIYPQPVSCQLGHRCLPTRGAIHILNQPVVILLSAVTQPALLSVKVDPLPIQKGTP